MKKFLSVLLIFCIFFIAGCSENNANSPTLSPSINGGSSATATPTPSANPIDKSYEYEVESYTEKTYAVINKDGTAEYYTLSDTYIDNEPVIIDWLKVSDIFGYEYVEYDAKVQSRCTLYGTFGLNGNILKLNLSGSYYHQYIIQGNDAEAFKAAYIANNPDKEDFFGKGVEDIYVPAVKQASAVIEISGTECKFISYSSNTPYEDSEIICNIDYTYLDNGKLSKYIETSSYKDTSRTFEVVYTYNDDGSYEVKSYENGKLLTENKYNSEDNAIFTKDYNEDGNIWFQRIYDDQGNTIKEINYLYEFGYCGELLYYSETEFNAANRNVLKKTEYNINGEITSYTIYEYDETDSYKIKCSNYYANGNICYYTTFDIDGISINETIYEYSDEDHTELVHITKYEDYRMCSDDYYMYLKKTVYDINGKILELTIYADSEQCPILTYTSYIYDEQSGELECYIVYEYDENNGSLLSEIQYDANGNIISKE